MPAGASFRSSASYRGRSLSCRRPPRLHVRQNTKTRSMCAARTAGGSGSAMLAPGDSPARDPSSRVSSVLIWHAVSLCITAFRLALQTCMPHHIKGDILQWIFSGHSSSLANNQAFPACALRMTCLQACNHPRNIMQRKPGCPFPGCTKVRRDHRHIAYCMLSFLQVEVG